jgi:replicative DNA helicase
LESVGTGGYGLGGYDDSEQDESEDGAVVQDNSRIISNLEQEQEVSKLPVLPPLKSGLKYLDEICDGFAPGELVVLSGAPKHGKSLFMKTIVNNLYGKQHKFSLVFSYEETKQEFYNKFPNRSKDIVFYVPRNLKPYDIEWIVAMAKEAKEQVGISAIFIDHGHYMFELSMANNISLGIGDIIRKLKILAVSEELVVFLVWHLMKVEINDEDDLKGSMLRDCGLLLGELDTLLFSFRAVKSDGIVCDETYSSIVVDRTRRTGVMHKVVPVRKVGYYIKEHEEVL